MPNEPRCLARALHGLRVDPEGAGRHGRGGGVEGDGRAGRAADAEREVLLEHGPEARRARRQARDQGEIGQVHRQLEGCRLRWRSHGEEGRRRLDLRTFLGGVRVAGRPGRGSAGGLIGLRGHSKANSPLERREADRRSARSFAGAVRRRRRNQDKLLLRQHGRLRGRRRRRRSWLEPRCWDQGGRACHDRSGQREGRLLGVRRQPVAEQVRHVRPVLKGAEPVHRQVERHVGKKLGTDIVVRNVKVVVTVTN